MQPTNLPDPATDEIPPSILAALVRLNQIGNAINGTGATSQTGMEDILRLIVESSIQVVTGACAIICAYDEGQETFDVASRTTAGVLPGDVTCPDALGLLAIHQRRRVLSYDMSAASSAEVQVVAAFPLLATDEAVGVLYVFLQEARSFRPLELLMLENLVNQAAMAVYRARQLASVQRDLARKEDELVRLRYAGLLISSRLRLEETLEAILQMALEVTGAHYGVFRLVDKGGRDLVTRAIAGEHLGQPATEPLPINTSSVMGWVAKSGRPLRIPDLREDPWVRIYYPLDRQLEMRSELAVPLIGTAGRLEGVLNLESPAVDAFSEADSHLLQALATQAVIAIQQARLLNAMQEIAGRLLTQPLQQVLDRLAELAGELLGRAEGVAWRQEGEHWRLSVRDADSIWDQKVVAILDHYAALACQNAERQEALRTAQERQAVAETFAALGDIAANLLHQLNNKVGAIPVRVEGIQDKCAAAVAASPYLATNLAEIEKSAVEAMDAVRESLRLLYPIHLEPLAVADCVQAALAAVPIPTGIEVRTDGLDGLPRVLAGRQGFTLVIVNLLGNALEAMADRGEIDIHGVCLPDEVQVVVTDSGPGIPPELHERIFELDFSGRKPDAAHKLGFGLWWVKTLMARLGGSVHVESDGRHGTTFRLTLPRAEGKV